MATIEDKAKALQQAKNNEFASACPSRVIEMALEDVEILQRSDKYKFRMGDIWHRPVGDKCAVCFAGAVMANRLRVPATENADPEDFEDAIQVRLSALNLFRQGLVGMGLDEMVPRSSLRGERENGFWWHLPVRRFHGGGKGFKADMRSIAEMLKSKGL